MSTRIRALRPQWYVPVFIGIHITQSSTADRSSVTVSFSKYEAETGPGVLISHNRRNCGLKFGIRYAIPVLFVLVTYASLSQSSSRFLIRD